LLVFENNILSLPLIINAFYMAETRNLLILADNQPVTRLGAITVWNNTFPGGEILSVCNKAELVHELTQHPRAIIIMDYTLFDFSSFDNLLIISMRFPFARWIFFSNDLNELILRRIIVERSFSVIMKDVPIEEMVMAFREAAERKPYICRRTQLLLQTKRQHEETEQKEKLTSTEREILKSIAQGKTSQMIADERYLSKHTISTHRKNIFRKIGVSNVYEATKYAAKVGMIDVADYYI